MKHLLISCLLLVSFSSTIAANAQLNEQLQLQSTVAVRNIDRLCDALDSYYSKRKSLPKTEKDMDRFLPVAFKQAMNENVGPELALKNVGNQRTFGTLRIQFDARAANPTQINGVYKLPDDWTCEPGNTAIVTDGDNHAVLFTGGMDGKPQNIRCITVDGSSGKKYDFGADDS
jgi:hypothetical protein